jgi:hypothetical protein
MGTVKMTKRPKLEQPKSKKATTNISGGVNADQIDVAADVVGRDKNTYITFAEKPGKPFSRGRIPDRRIIVGASVGVILVVILVLMFIFRPTPIILTNSNWNNYVEDTARSSLSLKAVPGTNHAIDISFDLKPGGWAGIYKKLSLPPFRSIKVFYKGTGASNTIELKLIDKNETIFEARWPHTTNTGGQGQSWELPYSEFRCRKGSGTCQDENAVRSLTLRPEDLDRIDVSFANKSEYADEAGSGQVIIEEIQIVP